MPQEVVSLTKLPQLAYDATADKHFQQELASVEMGKKEANKKKLADRPAHIFQQYLSEEPYQ